MGVNLITLFAGYMNRRDFLLSSVFTAACVMDSFALKAIPNRDVIAADFNKFIGAVKAHALPQIFVNDEVLKSLKVKHSSSLCAMGYRSSEELYFCDNNNVVFFPLVLEVDTTYTDRAVLFFTRNEKNEWHYTKTYSGFQIEILADLLDHVHSSVTSEEIPGLLLPAQRNPVSHPSDVFYTRNALIRFNVRIGEGKTLLDYELNSISGDIHIAQQSSSKLFANNTVFLS